MDIGDVYGKQSSSKRVALAASYERKDHKDEMGQVPAEKNDECSGAPIQDHKDEMGLMARNFSKAFKRVERGNKNSFGRNQTGEREKDRTMKKNELQCHKCQGYGHFKTDYPSAKRKSLIVLNAGVVDILKPIA